MSLCEMAKHIHMGPCNRGGIVAIATKWPEHGPRALCADHIQVHVNAGWAVTWLANWNPLRKKL